MFEVSSEVNFSAAHHLQRILRFVRKRSRT